MKKFLTVLLILVMVFTFAACGNGGDQGDGGNAEVSFDDISDNYESEDGTYQIAMVTDVGQLKDGSFNQFTWNGVKKYAYDNNKSYKYYQPANDANATDEDRIKAMTDACDAGAEVLVTPGYLQETALKAVAPKYPDVQFVFIDGWDMGMKNLVGVSYQEEQAGYFAGYATVMDGYTKLGFSGGGGGPRWRRNNGLVATKTLGANFATETSKLELDGSVRYDYKGADIISTNSSERFLQNGSSYSNSNAVNKNKNSDVFANFRLEWKPDSMTNIIFRPNFSYGKTNGTSGSESGTFNSDPYSLIANPNDFLDFDKLEDDPLESIRVNATNDASLTKSKSISTSATLQLNRKLNNRGRNITFRGRFSYGDNDNDQYRQSETRYYQILNALGGDSVLYRNQYITTPTNNYNYSAQVTYSEPIARATFLQFSYQFQYKYSESDKTTFDMLDYPEWDINGPLPSGYESHAVDSLGKYAEYRYYNHDASVSLRFIREKYQLSAGMSFQPQHSVLSYKRGDYMIDTARNVFNFAPNIDFRYRFSKVSQLRFMYRGRSSQPGMENLLPIADNSNPLNIRVGNPGLKPAFTHNMRLFYNTYNGELQRGMMTHLSFSTTQNSISNSTVYNEQTGGRTTTPKNINGNWSAFGMFGFNTALKNKKFTVNSFSQLRYNNNVAFLYDQNTKQDNKNTTTELMLSERVNGAYRNDWFEFGVNGSVSYTAERSKLRPENNQNPYTFSYGALTNITMPWKMTLSTNITNQSRRGYTDSSMNRNELIWNAQLSQSFLKGAATVSFEMYDILKQQSNISRSLTADGRSVSSYNGVNSYCMLHFIYRLNIFGGKGARESMRGRQGFGGPGPGGHRGGFGGGRRPF